MIPAAMNRKFNVEKRKWALPIIHDLGDCS